MGSWLVGVERRGFRLGITLGDSVRVREGLSGIAVGGRGVRPRDGEARDRRPATAAASAAGPLKYRRGVQVAAKEAGGGEGVGGREQRDGR